MWSVNIIDIAIITVKNVDYRYIIHNISRSEPINLLKSAVLKDPGYIYKKIPSIKSSFFTFYV